MDGETPPTPSELTIMIAGAVMLVASFLPFAASDSAWARFNFPVVTLLPLYGVVMAAQIGLTKFGRVNLPETLAGFTWEQAHLILGILAGFMSIGWLMSDVTRKGAGFWLEVLGGFALAVGALVMQKERQTGAIG